MTVSTPVEGMNMETKGLVNAEWVAARLDVPVSWVYRAARREEIPHIPVGRYVRFRPDQIEEWLAAQTRGVEDA